MDIAFLLFLPMSGSTGMAVPARLVVGIMAVFAISELLISPIGLSVTTKLAPEAFRADDGAVLLLRRAWDVDVRCAGTLYDPAREFAYFGIIGAMAIVAGTIVFALAGRWLG